MSWPSALVLPGPGAALLGDPGRRRRDEARRGRARLVARDLDARRPATGDRVEVDDRDDPARVRVALDEARWRRGRRTTPPSVERKISWWFGPARPARVRRPGRPYARANSISAAVPEALSFAPAPRPGVVAVGHHHDRVGVCGARRERHVSEKRPAASRDRLLERVHLRDVRVEPHPVDQPAARTQRPDGSGRAVRVQARELLCERRARTTPSNGGRRGRRCEREPVGALDAEGGDEQRQPDEQPRPAVQAAVDGTLGRAAPAPPAGG